MDYHLLDPDLTDEPELTFLLLGTFLLEIQFHLKIPFSGSHIDFDESKLYKETLCQAGSGHLRIYSF